MKRIDSIRDERGTTLVEVTMATAIGLVVLLALTMVMLVTLHGSAKVSARVDATQRARVVLASIIGELHSACVTPKIAPVQKESSGTLLRFIHADSGQGAEVAPKPILSEISLSGGVLSQTDFAATNETAPFTFSLTAIPPGTRQLITKVSPIAPSSSIFSYFAYANGALSETPLGVPLEPTGAESTVEVRVALTAAPSSTPVADSGAATSIQNSAVLRLTPPSFNEGAVSLPCQ